MYAIIKFMKLCREFDEVSINKELRFILMKIEFCLIGWIRFSDHCLKVIKLISPPNEYLRYAYFSQYMGPLCLLLPITSLVIIAKRGYFPIYLFSLKIRTLSEQQSADHHMGFNLSQTRTVRESDMVKYGDCLMTDCKPVKEAGLYTLPLFAMCNTELSQYYNPYIGLGVFGVVMDLCFTYHTYIFGIALPIFLYLRHCRDEIYIFVVCPKTVCTYRYNRIRIYIRDFHGSFLNYYRYVLEEYKQRTHKLSIFSSDLRRTTDPSIRDDLKIMDERHIVQREAQRFSEFDRQLYELSPYAWSCIEDSSSIFRTSWWQLIAMRQLNVLTLVIAVIQIAVVILLSFITDRLIRERKGELAQLSERIQSTGCFFRLNQQQGLDYNAQVDLTRFLPEQWHFVPLLEVLIVLVTSIYSTSTILATFCIIYNDAITLIAEQLDRIWLVIELTVHIDTVKDNTSSKSLDWQIDKYKFHDLKLMHQRLVDKSKYVYCLRTSNFHSISTGRETPRKLVRQLVEQHYSIDLDNYCTLLSRIYTCNRALFGKADDLSIALSAVLGAFVAWSQGLIIMIIIFNKSSDQSNILPTVFATLGILLNSFLISFPSQFQVESRQIVKLMLKLLARTVHLDDIRISHARVLWLRQVESISQNNGLTLIAFGMPITYATTIRLALISLTMITIWLS